MITTLLGTLRYVSGYDQDTDFVDRLHSFLTVNIVIALSILVSFKMFGGRPVECIVPDQCSGACEEYAENFCWAQDTYFLPFTQEIPRGVETRREANISYYQWVPFFLLLEAACFRIPSLVWKHFAGHSGLKIHEVIKIALDKKNLEPEIRKNNIRSLTIHIQNALKFHRRLVRKNINPHKVVRILNLPYSAFFVTTMYLTTKLLYLLNVCLQLYLMNSFLGTDQYSWYGFGAIRDLLNGTQWDVSGIFPRVTLCDFQVRVMGNLQRYSVQCVLVINIFNEKIFVFLWFWFTTLMILTTVSFVYWFLVTVLPWPGKWFISRHLELSDMTFDPHEQKSEVERFTNNYLKCDGVFILRVITMHSGIIFGTDLIVALYRSFYGIEEQVKTSLSCEGALTPLAVPPPDSHHEQNRAHFLRFRGKGGGGDERLIPPPPPATAPPMTLDQPDGAPRRPSLSLKMPPPPAPAADADYETARSANTKA